jgi:hypothetical protein
MFKEGMKPLDVAIELDLAIDYVILIQKRFWQLNGMHGFNQAYDSVKGNITPYLRLFDLMNSLGLTPEQVQEQVKYGYELPQLQTMYSNLSSDVHDLEREKLNLSCQLQFMAEPRDRYLRDLEYYNYQCEMKKKELLALDTDINSKNATEQTNFVIQNNSILIMMSNSATLEALRRYPDYQQLIFELLESQTSGEWYQQSWINSHGPQLFQLTQHIQGEIAGHIARMAVATVESSRLEIETSQV